MAASATRTMRCENRLSSVPWSVTVVPAARSPVAAASR